jgi:hypothetical protein
MVLYLILKTKLEIGLRIVSICLCASPSHPRLPLWSSGQSSWLQIQRSRFDSLALPEFLRSSGSGTGSTQAREYSRRVNGVTCVADK